MSLLVGALAVFLCGMLAGYRYAWLDAYEKGRQDAMPPAPNLQLPYLRFIKRPRR